MRGLEPPFRKSKAHACVGERASSAPRCAGALSSLPRAPARAQPHALKSPTSHPHTCLSILSYPTQDGKPEAMGSFAK